MRRPNAAQIVAAYERGLYVRDTMILELVQCGTEYPPAESASGIPADVLDELRERSHDLEAAERIIIFRSVCNAPGYDGDAVMREDKRRYVVGLRNWRAYFDGVADGSVAPPGLGSERR